MPAVEPPRQQQPMEATASAATGTASQGELVTQQPVCVVRDRHHRPDLVSSFNAG